MRCQPQPRPETHAGKANTLFGFVCFIIVPIKQFQDGGVVHGIIGIVTCGIWTFIWGWINAGRLNIRNTMMIWTLPIVVGIVLNVLGGGFYSTSPTTTPWRRMSELRRRP